MKFGEFMASLQKEDLLCWMLSVSCNAQKALQLLRRQLNDGTKFASIALLFSFLFVPPATAAE